MENEAEKLIMAILKLSLILQDGEKVFDSSRKQRIFDGLVLNCLIERGLDFVFLEMEDIGVMRRMDGK